MKNQEPPERPYEGDQGDEHREQEHGMGWISPTGAPPEDSAPDTVAPVEVETDADKQIESGEPKA